MFDRLLSSRRSMWTTFAATGALFLVLAVLLGVQMALGRDPSMGDRTANRPSPGDRQQKALVQPQPRQQVAPQGQTYGDGDGRGYDDGSGYGYDQGQGYDDGSGYGYPQQQAPQQQGPPMQSGTS